MSGPTIDRANSSGDIWTPQIFIDAVVRKFGPLAVDLAGSERNKKAPLVITERMDSLKQDWATMLSGGLGWLNPPYSRIAPWAKKCADEWKLGAEILLLVPMGGQNWYWDHVEPFAQVYGVGRMTFDNCFDKHGQLVTTNYPKDLILAHYEPGKHGNRPKRWRWEQ